MSLMAIMRENPDLAKRLEEGTKEVRESKANLVAAANGYNERYEKEINEGTEKRKLLLEHGREQGKSEEEIFAEYNRFIPTKYTPILNFLFFMMRDGNRPDWVSLQKKVHEQYGHVDLNLASAVSEDELESVYGQLIHEDEQDLLKDNGTPSMDSLIYGECTHKMFVRIKKLKAMSKSNNENEAFLAYRLCMKLCKKFGLDFDRIPCNIDEHE